MADQDKLEAFRSYNFDGSPQWQTYRANLEIPAGRDIAATLERFKVKWYQREVDPEFDLSSLRPSASKASTEPEAASSGQPSPAHQGDQTGAQSQAREVPTPPQTAPSRPWSKLPGLSKAGPQTLLFALHSALIGLALVHLQPLNRRWSYYAWIYFLQLSLLTSGYKVYLKYGVPRLRPFPAALKQWAAPASQSSDFQYAMLSLLFLGSKPVALVLVPITVLATYHWFAFAQNVGRIRNTGLWQRYGQSAHRWLAAHQADALLYNAVAEIGVGFVTLLGLLFPPRHILTPFLVFNFLRMRYWSPDSSPFHRQAWTIVDQRAGPILTYVPLLRVPVQYVQKWFLSAPGR